MGADNWMQCPRCRVNLENEIERRKAELKEKYGKVSQANYEKLKHELASMNVRDLDSTLREDYEIGIAWNGVFEANYRGSCDKCNFSLEFNHEQVVIEEAQPKEHEHE